MTTAGGQAAVSGAGSATYRLLYVSVRGHRCLLGGSTIDADAAVPDEVGTRFDTFGDIDRHVRHDLHGVSAYWQVQAVDDDGTIVRFGFRSGYNGTGEHWHWCPAAP